MFHQIGKSTYRTEILFKKFRWRPNYKDKSSKAYRDLINGIKVTVCTKRCIKQQQTFFHIAYTDAN